MANELGESPPRVGGRDQSVPPNLLVAGPPPLDDPPDAPPSEDDASPGDPIYGYSEDVDVPRQPRRREVWEALQFIEELESATLDRSGLTSAAVARLRQPRHAVASMTAHERVGIRIFLARGDASEDNYRDTRAAVLELHPEDEAIPSYEGVKRLIS
ncbi:hypothetical protein C8Q77DRAFT_1160964 [Trametes polyzona]|nr:hypothetical protein C8Q77DRAFT_1160964 [Trametes polyzona]